MPKFLYKPPNVHVGGRGRCRQKETKNKSPGWSLNPNRKNNLGSSYIIASWRVLPSLKEKHKTTPTETPAPALERSPTGLPSAQPLDGDPHSKSHPAQLRPGRRVCVKLPKYSTATYLSWTVKTGHPTARSTQNKDQRGSGQRLATRSLGKDTSD